MRQIVRRIRQRRDLRHHIGAIRRHLRRNLRHHHRGRQPNRTHLLQDRLGQLANNVAQRRHDNTVHHPHNLSQNPQRSTHRRGRTGPRTQRINRLRATHTRSLNHLPRAAHQQRRHIRLQRVSLSTHRLGRIRPRLRMSPHLIRAARQLIHPLLERLKMLNQIPRAPRHQRRNRIHQPRSNISHGTNRRQPSTQPRTLRQRRIQRLNILQQPSTLPRRGRIHTRGHQITYTQPTSRSRRPTTPALQRILTHSPTASIRPADSNSARSNSAAASRNTCAVPRACTPASLNISCADRVNTSNTGDTIAPTNNPSPSAGGATFNAPIPTPTASLTASTRPAKRTTSGTTTLNTSPLTATPSHRCCPPADPDAAPRHAQPAHAPPHDCEPTHTAPPTREPPETPPHTHPPPHPPASPHDQQPPPRKHSQTEDQPRHPHEPRPRAQQHPRSHTRSPTSHAPTREPPENPPKKPEPLHPHAGRQHAQHRGPPTALPHEHPRPTSQPCTPG